MTVTKFIAGLIASEMSRGGWHRYPNAQQIRVLLLALALSACSHARPAPPSNVVVPLVTCADLGEPPEVGSPSSATLRYPYAIYDWYYRLDALQYWSWRANRCIKGRR